MYYPAQSMHIAYSVSEKMSIDKITQNILGICQKILRDNL